MLKPTMPPFGGTIGDTVFNRSSAIVAEVDCECQEVAEDLPGRVAEAYKDSVAKSGTSPCGGWAVLAECESGDHRFAKRILCGKEWCEVCGEDDSASHKRRQARLLPKLQQVRVAGYLVIEFPLWARQIGEKGLHADNDGGQVVAGWCYSAEDLKATTKIITDVLAGKRTAGGRGRKRKGGYFKRGVGRWHWFGDKKAGRWNPHYNVLVDFESAEFEHDGRGYIPKAVLRALKGELREALNCPDLIVHYSYADNPAGISHKVRYITRSTFRSKSWQPYMAEELWNYRNVRWWGSWKSAPLWELAQGEGETGSLQPVTRLQEGWCPDCGCRLKVLGHNAKGQAVRWTQAFQSKVLESWHAEEISGSGYYRIPHVAKLGSCLTPDELLRLNLRAADRLSKRSVQLHAVAMRKPIEELWKLTKSYRRMRGMGYGREEQS